MWACGGALIFVALLMPGVTSADPQRCASPPSFNGQQSRSDTGPIAWRFNARTAGRAFRDQTSHARRNSANNLRCAGLLQVDVRLAIGAAGVRASRGEGTNRQTTFLTRAGGLFYWTQVVYR